MFKILRFIKKWNDIDLDNKTDRRSYLGPYEVTNLKRPLNPIGRTGISGRGYLEKWGPNHTVNPIVTRFEYNMN